VSHLSRNNIQTCASLELLVSILVETYHKSQAMEQAEFKVNEKNIRLQNIVLMDIDINKYVFFVHQVKFVEWFHIQPTEYSHRFRVNGRMEFLLSHSWDTSLAFGANPGCEELFLPKTAIHPTPVLAIPTTKDSVYLQVRKQLLKWIPEPSHNAIQI
jgi:hypothetical protein